MSHSGGKSEAIDVKLTGSCQELVGGGELNGENPEEFCCDETIQYVVVIVYNWQNRSVVKSRASEHKRKSQHMQ